MSLTAICRFKFITQTMKVLVKVSRIFKLKYNLFISNLYHINQEKIIIEDSDVDDENEEEEEQIAEKPKKQNEKFKSFLARVFTQILMGTLKYHGVK
ncbi:hypothetical protein TTHERM_01683270 (macronuclear) [Tetrahymena thermophila SB210]|uniref:Uncharacterized protein n=1 Tax=Tetrahymena thermophila (strain SB210) TaxID=312017 RepID=Q227V2_TETTS|nr:hypothetical protein TTHERM_01683270 [Tetrahymena thermophila SB210]EAR81570.2 hypothetical protein TTHERM_01683270 [Tetrahymena thermophila SB210]|eukprot:XP_001029233.2 hypothetical protein TTHERM_01683270 [Tetrahymena thermophila SB210]